MYVQTPWPVGASRLTRDTGSASANDALSITLLTPTRSGLQPLTTFGPKFTYPIFGDDETIFGYKNLKINLRYRANDMRPHVSIKYSKKVTWVGNEPADIKAILQDNQHLPKGKPSCQRSLSLQALINPTLQLPLLARATSTRAPNMLPKTGHRRETWRRLWRERTAPMRFGKATS